MRTMLVAPGPDVAMATPALRALRRHFGPQARIVGVMRPYLADVLAGTPWLDEQWFFNPHAKDRALHAWAVARRMREEGAGFARLRREPAAREAFAAFMERRKPDFSQA